MVARVSLLAEESISSPPHLHMSHGTNGFSPGHGPSCSWPETKIYGLEIESPDRHKILNYKDLELEVKDVARDGGN